MVVEGSIAFRYALQLVVEVDDDLTQGQVKEDLDTVARDVLLLDELPTLTEAERHDRTDVGGIRDDRSADIRLFDVVDRRDVGKSGGVMYLLADTLLVVDLVGYVGDGRDDVHTELSVESFLNDLHVQEPKEAASEAEAKSDGALWLEGQ